MDVFKSVDTADRGGTRDASVCSRFYVAGLFIDVLAQFYDGELPPDLAEKTRYAKFRAFQIRDFIKRGVDPPPPPEPQGTAADADLVAEYSQIAAQGAVAIPAVAAPTTAHQGMPATASPTQPVVQPAPAPAQPQATVPPAAVRPLAPLAPLTAPQSPAPPKTHKEAAQRKLEFAISALDFADVPTAIRYLRETLEALDRATA